ncbi:MAG TPA: GFA family protein [Polyangiaceae bacterium]
MAKATCLCAGVTWRSDSFEHMTHCYCSRCRKFHGTPFATTVVAERASFSLTGESLIVAHRTEGGGERRFCGRCGSAVPEAPRHGGVVVPAGNFDADPGVRPEAHHFVASKAPWFALSGDLPRFDAYPPGVEAVSLPTRSPLDPEGSIRGSCLCGAVTFVVDGKLIGARYCHCTRCRKGRSAAHASNLLAAADAVRFTRGQELIASYKVPKARYFMHCFCRRCGSPVPRIDAGRSLGVVPMGALDDDVPLRPACHIFFASKAPWYSAADDLPRYDEYPPPA